MVKSRNKFETVFRSRSQSLRHVLAGLIPRESLLRSGTRFFMKPRLVGEPLATVGHPQLPIPSIVIGGRGGGGGT